MARRSESWQVAPALVRSICEGWYAGWARPCGGCGFWANVWADLTKSVSSAIGRWASVRMVEASEMRGADGLYLHKAPRYMNDADETRIIFGDVIVVHDDIDVLVMSCSQEIDNAL